MTNEQASDLRTRIKTMEGFDDEQREEVLMVVEDLCRVLGQPLPAVVHRPDLPFYRGGRYRDDDENASLDDNEYILVCSDVELWSLFSLKSGGRYDIPMTRQEMQDELNKCFVYLGGGVKS